MMDTVRRYYELGKPGIVRGNLITIIAGYLLGARGSIDIWQVVWLAVGSTLVIASSCVVNNIFDRDIDKHMKRTKSRALVTGKLNVRSAVIFAALTGLIGLMSLFIFVSITTALLGAIGHLLYAGLYTYSKRKTHYSTLIGTLPGAIPPVAGYVASSEKLDLTAMYLFLILVCWQMPHFLAIGIRRAKEYSQAKIPLLNLVKGNDVAKRHIYFYILGFIASSLLLGAHEHLGGVYSIVMTMIGGAWLYSALDRMPSTTDEVWAKKVFLLSLLALLVFDILISLAHLLP